MAPVIRCFSFTKFGGFVMIFKKVLFGAVIVATTATLLYVNKVYAVKSIQEPLLNPSFHGVVGNKHPVYSMTLQDNTYCVVLVNSSYHNSSSIQCDFSERIK